MFCCECWFHFVFAAALEGVLLSILHFVLSNVVASFVLDVICFLSVIIRIYFLWHFFSRLIIFLHNVMFDKFFLCFFIIAGTFFQSINLSQLTAFLCSFCELFCAFSSMSIVIVLVVTGFLSTDAQHLSKIHISFMWFEALFCGNF